jgi:hypothetical protein
MFEPTHDETRDTLVRALRAFLQCPDVQVARPYTGLGKARENARQVLRSLPRPDSPDSER